MSSFEDIIFEGSRRVYFFQEWRSSPGHGWISLGLTGLVFEGVSPRCHCKDRHGMATDLGIRTMGISGFVWIVLMHRSQPERSLEACGSCWLKSFVMVQCEVEYYLEQRLVGWIIGKGTIAVERTPR